jgi:radical SAM superfamily enzyme YgiQ (UPF0313 family)
MTPEQISAWLDGNLHRCDQPAQYLGDEPNSYRRDWGSSSVRMLMAASWPYFHAAGNQSIPAVYKTVNDASPGYLCDRFYLPETPRDLRLLERAGIPVFGIESRHQLRDFDVVGTSISYMVLIMSFAKMLTMSGMPLRWAEREARGAHNYPMVMVGGQAYCAPGPLEPIADCIFLGEAEDEPGNGGLGRVLKRIEQFKSGGNGGLWFQSRIECYRRLAREFNYLYFPRFVGVDYEYQERGLPELSRQVSGYHALLPGMRMPFLKRFVKDLDAIAPLDNPPLLYVDPSLGGGDLEAARGCTAWCSFCRLSWVQKPQRQRSVGYLTRFAKSLQLNMGSVELSPFGPDWPMVTNKKRVMAALLSQVNDEVDATAMRIDDFIADHEFIQLQAMGGMDSATLGLEGNSQRMRDLVGKGVSDHEVEEAVTAGIRAGLRKFKLFMITNLPGEDEGDVLRIVRLARRLADIRDQLGQPNVRIQFSWTPLLIEAQTPFQWFAPTAANHALIDVADYFRDLKIDFKIGVKAEPNKVAFFQLCQRASRDVGEAIVDVLADLDTACWGGVPRDMRERLDLALRARGFRNGFGDCFDERYQGDLFGWEFIDTGISRSLMWDTYLQMREFCEYTDSATYDQEVGPGHHGQEWIARCDEKCLGNSCGVCDGADLKRRAEYIRDGEHEAEVSLADVHPVDQTSVAMRIRARLERKDAYRYVEAGTWRHIVRRAAYRAVEELTSLPPGISIAKRSLRFASDAVKYRDWTSGVDYLDFGMTQQLTAPQVGELLDAMDHELRQWVRIGDWQTYSASVSLPPADRHLFQLEVDQDASVLAERLAIWQGAEFVKMVLKQESAYFAQPTETVNAKELTEDLWVVRGEGTALLLKMVVKGRAGPYNVLAALLGKASWIEAAARPAVRLDSFLPDQPGQSDFLHPECSVCGQQVPTGMLDEPWDADLCPRCQDETSGAFLVGLPKFAVAGA